MMNSSPIASRPSHTQEVNNNPAQSNTEGIGSKLASTASHLAQQLTNSFYQLMSPRNLLAQLFSFLKFSPASLFAQRTATAQITPEKKVECTGDHIIAELEKDPNVTHLKLTGAITPAHIESLKNASSLTSLDLSAAKDVNDECIASIPKHCPKLKHINLEGRNKISDKGLTGFSALKGVEIFNISNCPDVTTLEFAKQWSGLTSLQLKGCSGIKTGELENLHQATKLQKFALTNNANASEAELSSLLSKLTQLDELSLVNNANLTDSVMAAIGNNNPKLVKLDVSKAKQITDNGIDHITTLSALESLNISFCANTGDKSLALIGQNLNNLETLNISSCATATDNGIAHLDNLSKLSTLTMQSLPKITAKALSHIPQSVNKLVAAFCPGIDSLDGLRAVSHFVFVNLMNTKIADKDIMRFTESKNMKFLGIMNCPNITVDGLREFIRNEPNPNIGIATNLKP